MGDNPKKFFYVGAQLPPQEREELIKFLKRKVDVFVWSAYKALGWIRASSVII